MNKRTLLALGISALTVGNAFAQTAIDAYTINPTELRGTARFVAMGGAFTSLGSDLSCLKQNPAGLGLYRRSDIGLTFDVSFRNSQGNTNTGKYKESYTKAYFDNFGYVGVSELNSTMSFFQWGVGYNRLATFDRRTKGYVNPAQGSLTNYIARVTDGTDAESMLESDGYDPYFDGSADWLSILAYNSFMINEDGTLGNYSGLRQGITSGDGYFETQERGYIDEYNIDFAGNISDIFFWGLGVGIVDMNYTRESYYSESMKNALVYDSETDYLTDGNAGFNLYNNKYISGTGANLKFGVIVRPIDILRVGIAIHTPTWMHLNHSGYADTDFNYTPNNGKLHSGNYSTPAYDYSSRLNNPWKFMLGASVMLGDKAILSADYERVAYSDMKVKLRTEGYFGNGYESDEAVDNDVKSLFKASNILRIGLEYRLSNSVSARVGYNYQSSAVTQRAMDGIAYVSTAGTDPSYALYNGSNNFCLGIGYRYGGWYIDAAYQYNHQSGTFHAFTSENDNIAPSANCNFNRNNLVISTGIRF